MFLAEIEWEKCVENEIPGTEWMNENKFTQIQKIVLFFFKYYMELLLKKQ